ncbi:hypothetical protein [Kineosporia sp. R_H_3]|uniref:hypothetical protein n=1 Tax=Kineosporia sp. R_H_3 TaxID=1961848 RepID=UPI000B4BBE34|nr:hypothetical protein [Kineosporia sp. R_H_3]
MRSDPGPALRLTGPSALLVLTGAERPGAATATGLARVHDRTVALHGWRTADTTLRLLRSVAGPPTLRPYSATLHAAQMLEDDAPGTAALCGLARTLLAPGERRRTLARFVVTAAERRLTQAPALPAEDVVALRTVLALAADHPDDAAVLAPLFLGVHEHGAGTVLHLPDGAPLAVVRGHLDLTVSTSAARLAFGGLRNSGDTNGEFTAALRPTSPRRTTSDELRTDAAAAS